MKQYRGNCQCCGRHQAVLDSGRMSKHGYKVDDGWFQGVCSGQKYPPMQKSRVATDEIVAIVRKDCDKLTATANSYRDGTAHPERILKSSYRRGDDPTMAWEDASEWQRKDGLSTVIHQLENRARAGRDFAQMLHELANEYHGQPLREVEVEKGPAPIRYGEKRRTPDGRVLKVVRVEGQRVYWKDGSGFGSWTGTSAWRKYELLPVDSASNTQGEKA